MYPNCNGNKTNDRKNKPKNEPQDIVSEILKSDMVTDFFLNIFHWKRTLDTIMKENSPTLFMERKASINVDQSVETAWTWHVAPMCC